MLNWSNHNLPLSNWNFLAVLLSGGGNIRSMVGFNQFPQFQTEFEDALQLRLAHRNLGLVFASQQGVQFVVKRRIATDFGLCSGFLKIGLAFAQRADTCLTFLQEN